MLILYLPPAYAQYIQSMSPGLKRAREPYRVKNAILGLTLGAFAVGVWAYSISAVKQDVFDDIDDEVVALEAPAPASASTPVPKDAAAVVQKVDNVRAAQAGLPLPPPPPPAPQSTAPRTAPPVRGVLQHLDSRWSTRLLDPKNKTLVWGAPPVDNVGKTGDS